jgi:hypothetical protein
MIAPDAPGAAGQARRRRTAGLLLLLLLVISLVGLGLLLRGSSEAPQGQPRGSGSTTGGVGVPSSVHLEPSDSIEITRPGTVVDGLDVDGVIYVRAHNVTLRNTRALSINTGGIDGGEEYHGTLIEDVTVDGRGVAEMGVEGLNYTARRVEVLRTKNGFRLSKNSTVEDSWVHDLFSEPGDHRSGIGANGGSDIIIRGNNIDCGTTPGCSGALVLYPQPSQTNVLVERNLLNGGGYCTYPPDHSASNVRYLNNEFGRRAYPNCGYYGPRAATLPTGNGNQWIGNVWQDTRQPVAR